MNASTAIDLVSNSVSSIFTKEDVLKILHQIRLAPVEPQGKVVTQNDMEDFIDYLEGRMSCTNAEDIVDFDSAEFSLEDGNQIVLYDIRTNIDSIVDDLSSAVREYFND